MKSINLGNRLTPFLLLACVMLIGVLALEQRQDGRRETASSPAQDTTPGPGSDVVQTRYVAPQMVEFSEILERPLFAANRQPPEPAPVAPPPTVQTRPDRFKLEGVAITPQAKVVVIRDLNRNELTRLSEGTTHHGWVVESVHPAGARLTRGEQSQELTLEPDDSPNRKY